MAQWFQQNNHTSVSRVRIPALSPRLPSSHPSSSLLLPGCCCSHDCVCGPASLCQRSWLVGSRMESDVGEKITGSQRLILKVNKVLGGLRSTQHVLDPCLPRASHEHKLQRTRCTISFSRLWLLIHLGFHYPGGLVHMGYWKLRCSCMLKTGPVVYPRPKAAHPSMLSRLLLSG